jgi:hypothetical protein
VRSGTPVITPTAPLKRQRIWANSTVLPTGDVLVTGGSSEQDEVNQGRAGEVHRTAELWSPATERWTELAAEANPRLYHSTAFLMPDATVVSAGGGAYRLPDDIDPSTINHLDAQTFSPRYLDPGERPVITTAPTRLSAGQSFDVIVDSKRPIERLALIKLPSVTHSFNNEQRFVPLTMTGQASGTITASAPSDTAAATPGWYYLFAVDDRGTPSVAPIVAFATT